MIFSESQTHYLFVYGTLRQAFKHAMHAVLANEAEYVDLACISGKLYYLSRYPGAVLTDTQEKVF